MGRPEADGGNGEIDVLAGAEVEGAGELEGYTCGGAWEGFKAGLCIAVAEVAVDEGHKADKPLQGPGDKDNG